MKILNLLTIIDKKHPLYIFFFETSKSWNCWPFYPTMSRTHTFEKRQCDRCRHRSAVKNMPPPYLSFLVPIPPPQGTYHPSANCPEPMISGHLDPVTSSANGVASLAQSIGLCCVPFCAPPPLLPSARKTGSSSGEKSLSISEGLGKEYMKWRKTSVGKIGTQAEGRHVVIRASQG